MKFNVSLSKKKLQPIIPDWIKEIVQEEFESGCVDGSHLIDRYRVNVREIPKTIVVNQRIFSSYFGHGHAGYSRPFKTFIVEDPNGGTETVYSSRVCGRKVELKEGEISKRTSIYNFLVKQQEDESFIWKWIENEFESLNLTMLEEERLDSEN